MRNYNALKIIATTYQIIAYLMIALCVIAILVIVPVMPSSEYSIPFLLGILFFFSCLFICFLAFSQSITLMIDMASDLSLNTNNTFIMAKHLEKSLQNQQAIIELLSKEYGGSSSPKINPDEL